MNTIELAFLKELPTLEVEDLDDFYFQDDGIKWREHNFAAEALTQHSSDDVITAINNFYSDEVYEKNGPSDAFYAEIYIEAITQDLPEHLSKEVFQIVDPKFHLWEYACRERASKCLELMVTWVSNAELHANQFGKSLVAIAYGNKSLIKDYLKANEDFLELWDNHFDLWDPFETITDGEFLEEVKVESEEVVA
jgi:hypothetical protein